MREVKGPFIAWNATVKVQEKHYRAKQLYKLNEQKKKKHELLKWSNYSMHFSKVCQKKWIISASLDFVKGTEYYQIPVIANESTCSITSEIIKSKIYGWFFFYYLFINFTNRTLFLSFFLLMFQSIKYDK